MDPYTSGPLRIDPDESMLAAAADRNGQPAEADPVTPRRADIDAKQALVAGVIRDMGCEAALLLTPAHVTWFTAGMNVRGLIADTERPGVYTNGQQRWVVCSNTDTQRLFDEELDRLGFQVKEWAWDAGRADLLANLVAGRKVACDRPIPNLPQLSERLRPLIRALSPFEQQAYKELGRMLAHALEATARNVARGQPEEEVAGQLGHRLVHHGYEPVMLSVTADGRGAKYRRAGFTSAVVERTCVLQATAQRDGLHVTASRTVSFGPPPDDFRAEYDLAWRLAAIVRALSRPGESVESAWLAWQAALAGTPYEFDWRLSQPGYGAGRSPGEELRRAGQHEPSPTRQPGAWPPRAGAAALVHGVVASAPDPRTAPPPAGGPP